MIYKFKIPILIFLSILIFVLSLLAAILKDNGQNYTNINKIISKDNECEKMLRLYELDYQQYEALEKACSRYEDNYVTGNDNKDY